MAIIEASEVEGWLKAGGLSNTLHTATVETVTSAVNAAVVRYCGRTFDKTAIASETAKVYGPRGRGQIRGIVSSCEAVVHDIWDTTNLVVKTDDGDDGNYSTTWDASDYTLEPLNQLDGDSYTPYWRIRAVGTRVFPTFHRRPALQVTAAWGWAAVPAEVKQAALIKAARVFTRKDSPQGVAGFGEFGVVRVSARMDPDVAEMLNPFRHPYVTALVA